MSSRQVIDEADIGSESTIWSRPFAPMDLEGVKSVEASG